MTTLAAAAIEYLAAGLPVIALTGKRPNTFYHRTWSIENAVRGTVETDEDLEIVTQVFTHAETTGIGLPIPEHLVVVDIDGEEGARRFVEITGLAPQDIPETVTARTGRGLHLWFFSPEIRHSARLGDKLDLKGYGGYVAAPPSQHFDAATGDPDYTYEWLVPMVNEHGIVGPFEWLPDGIEQLLTDRERADAIAIRGTRASDGGTMDGLVRAVTHAEEGNRNHLLYWAACAARDSGFMLEDVVRTLVPASTLPPQEAKRTVRSAFGQ